MVVSNGRQHRDEAVVPMRQRKGEEFVEDFLLVGDSGEQPVEVLFVDALGEESDNFEEVTSIGAEFAERWRSEGELYGCCQGLIAVRPR